MLSEKHLLFRSRDYLVLYNLLVQERAKRSRLDSRLSAQSNWMEYIVGGNYYDIICQGR